MSGQRKVFVLGDSRTGTMSLHQFLTSAGYKSVHYFVKESGVNEGGTKGIDASGNEVDNWTLVHRYIENSGFDAFSDYPTRMYFRQLMATYPDAFFILNTRKDLETWQLSMKSFMEKFKLKIDLPNLSRIHVQLNEQIRQEAARTGVRFCEICIDDPSDDNAHTLNAFLALEGDVRLGRENATAAYDPRLWSKRVTFFDTDATNTTSYVEQSLSGHKGMLSEYGWVFLANDSSDFLQYLFGEKVWSETDEANARSVLETRRSELKSRDICYRKYVVPEKTAVYPEYMPKTFARLSLAETRPACRMRDLAPEGYSYVHDVLQDAKSRGFLYFRGDSHTNWLGAYFIYHHIISTLNEDITSKRRREPIPLRDLKVQLAAYGGDIASQVRPDHAGLAKGAWDALNLGGDVFEHVVHYTLPDARRHTKPVPIPPVYDDRLGDRPIFRFRHEDQRLPRAVIFRDSTSDWLVELLAEHFSESFFVWYKGLVFNEIIDEVKPDVVLHIQAERFFSAYWGTEAFSDLP